MSVVHAEMLGLAGAVLPSFGAPRIHPGFKGCAATFKVPTHGAKNSRASSVLCAAAGQIGCVGPRPRTLFQNSSHCQPPCLIPQSSSPPRKSQEQQRPKVVAAAAADASVDSQKFTSSVDLDTQEWLDSLPVIGPYMQAIVHQYDKFRALSGKFLPMVGLFFLLAFNNAILDSLKDTLVITASGGGAQVIPYLTVYAVLPSSVLFLVLYSLATQRFGRATVFNVVVTSFLGFFAAFAAFMYPNHQTLHLSGAADALAHVLPSGLSGLVGMVRNWTFTLFFCMSELWGDVCLGLLFWGLANDTTALQDASTLYPLFGLGANMAQAMAGFVLKSFSGGSTAADFASNINQLMTVVMCFGAATLALHAYIDRQAKKEKQSKKENPQQQSTATAASSSASANISATAGSHSSSSSSNGRVQQLEFARPVSINGTHSSSEASTSGRSMLQQPVNGSHTHVGVNRTHKQTSNGTAGQLNGSHTDSTLLSSHSRHAASNSVSASSTSSISSSSSNKLHTSPTNTAQHVSQPTQEQTQPAEKKKQPIGEVYRVLASSTVIRCLAVMSLAQGLCTSLMEFAWKCHIKLMFPTPREFTGFLGDVSTWQGLVTMFLMVLSPAVFERLGWRGVASATPFILLFGGSAFFAAVLGYQFLFAGTPAASTAVATGLLNFLVFGGALLYVFSKSAKFSLFKPAEEMVYIGLDEEGRTKGKAAIDVVGSQAGKSFGSILQQVLLVACAGNIAGSIPIMFAVYFAMTRGWLKSVKVLSMEVDVEANAEKVRAQKEAEAANSNSSEVPATSVLSTLPKETVLVASNSANSSSTHNTSSVQDATTPSAVNSHSTTNGNDRRPDPSVDIIGELQAQLSSHRIQIKPHLNGHVNGYSNGHGHANGYSNGHGHANGHVKSHAISPTDDDTDDWNIPGDDDEVNGHVNGHKDKRPSGGNNGNASPAKQRSPAHAW